MNREALPFSLALVLALVWIYLFTRLLLHSQEGGVPWNPIKLRKTKLTGTQNFPGAGVLAFGVGKFIFDLSNRYIRWRLYRNPSDQLHFENVIQLLFFALLAGVIFGVISAGTSIFDRK